MNRFYNLLVLLIVLFSINLTAQQVFERSATIPVPEIENGGFGNVLAGVDVDGDGKMEIYAPNDNWSDDGEELIPRLYKYEQNGDSWDLVWQVTLDIPLQNTWPPIVVADLDKDGKQEIVWGPINNFTDGNENPDRIVIFETPGDGSDNMGVSDGFGGFAPNASFTIVEEDNMNVRPIKFIINDIDSDGTEEIIFADRKASSANYHYGVISVSDVPDNGDGSEVWSVEASGLGDLVLEGSEDKMDIAVLNGVIYIWEWFGEDWGRVFGIDYDNGFYTPLEPQKVEVDTFKLDGGTFKNAMTVDINGDGIEEIVYAEWFGNGKIILLEQVEVEGKKVLEGSIIGDINSLGSSTLTGGDYGDIDGDGLIDFVFGTRTGGDPNCPIIRLEYQGGPIGDQMNYVKSIIDYEIVEEGGQIDAISIANLDADPEDEVVYTGIPRSPAPVIPIVVLDYVAPEIPEDTFTRMATIPVPEIENGGFGNVLAGVDFDGDGNLEIYAPNDNWSDDGEELIPRLYKYEQNGSDWDLVWQVTLDIPLQNTWPPIKAADLDKDGKQEIIWGPINNFTDGNENPDRIVVFETPGDGTDDMGVSDGFGGFAPNASFTIVEEDNMNVRPIQFVIEDFDSDGTDEIIFADRKASSANFHYGVVSVDDIPDNGDGSETWTLEASGLGDFVLEGSEDKMDIAVLNGVIYVWEWFGSDWGRVFGIDYDNGFYTPTEPKIVEVDGYKMQWGTFKSAQVVDINGDGEEEIVYGEWFGDGRIVLLQQVEVEGKKDLVGSVIGHAASLGSTVLTGGASGDLDGDGNMDFVFGTRTGGDPNCSIIRLEYQGGDITHPDNYTISVIDSKIVEEGGQIDALDIADLNGDGKEEVIYTGIPRSPAPVIPIVILSVDGSVGIESDFESIPNKFELSQNYPNPFNPSTTIKFGLPNSMMVDLRIYNVLGQEVAALVSNQELQAGTYQYQFDASKLASGTYVYRIVAGGKAISKKMILIK